MIDDRTIELIHAGLDGELDTAGEAELRKTLEESEEARHHHSELSRLSVFLDKIPDWEMPQDLHARITADISLPARTSIKSILTFGQLPGLVRYGFAAAAGLVLAVAIYEQRDVLQDPSEFSSMVGTMTSGGPDGYQKELDTFSFEKDGISGDVSLQRRNGSVVLELELDADEPLEFDIDFSGNGLEFEAFAQLDTELVSVQYAEGVLRGRANGRRQRFVVLLHHAGTDEAGGRSRIDLEFKQQGTAIHAGWLEPDW